jgi:DNA-directed RNA polymerase subunit K
MRSKENYSHYERVRIISARALQISQGAPVLVKIPKGLTNPIEIATLEWDNEVIPIESVRRVE